MALEKPLFDIDQSNMQVAVNSYKPGNGLAWPQLFPLKFTPRFDIKGLEGDEGIPVSADKVAFNTKAPKKTRRTVGSWNGKLGKIAVSREKDEVEINDYRDLQTLAAANAEDKASAQYLVDTVYDDLKFCADAMDYKVQIDSMGIGSSGKQTFPADIEGDMATANEINFNVPTENFGGVSHAWSVAADADGLKDLADWQDKIAKQGKRKPMWAVMEKSKFNELTAQKSVARRLFPRYDQNLVTSDMMSVESVNAYMLGKGWPQILVIDTYATTENKKGVYTTFKPWNEAVVTLSPVPQLGYTYYKPVPLIQGTDAIQAQGSYYKMTRYSEMNPMLEVTMAEAYVQCGLTNRSSLVFINTTKATWE